MGMLKKELNKQITQLSALHIVKVWEFAEGKTAGYRRDCEGGAMLSWQVGRSNHSQLINEPLSHFEQGSLYFPFWWF